MLLETSSDRISLPNIDCGQFALIILADENIYAGARKLITFLGFGQERLRYNHTDTGPV